MSYEMCLHDNYELRVMKCAFMIHVIMSYEMCLVMKCVCFCRNPKQARKLSGKLHYHWPVPIDCVLRGNHRLYRLPAMSPQITTLTPRFVFDPHRGNDYEILMVSCDENRPYNIDSREGHREIQSKHPYYFVFDNHQGNDIDNQGKIINR